MPSAFHAAKSSPSASTALVWFRRDLRLIDNPALEAALRGADRVVPVFVHAPDEEAPWAPGAASNWWLHHSLEALAEKLRELGAPIWLGRGSSLEQLRRIIAATGATSLHFNRLYEPAALARDHAVASALGAAGIEVHGHNAALIREPQELQTGAGKPYRVFTPFARALAASGIDRRPRPAPRSLTAPASLPPSLALDQLRLLPSIGWAGGIAGAWTPGEDGALAALDRFCDDALEHYAAGRDIPGAAGTSRLSPHLHFGEIGPVQVWARLAALDSAAGVETFQRELIWREFAHHLLFHFPRSSDEPLDAGFAAFPWRQHEQYRFELAAWQRGRTGFPIVDAGLRELWATGWMHNRVRMIVASFLTKNLLVPWQEGARWFWDTLVDADLPNNSLGWQWSAGCGADAAPFFRIFNPVLQSQKFDPRGVYLRRWLPELRRLDDDEIHAPWLRRDAPGTGGVRLGDQYPEPLVDLAATRARALAAYKNRKSAPIAAAG